MNEDLRVVFESRNRQSCADRALVLSSLQIPHQLIDDGGSCAVLVPAEVSAQAAKELRLYEEENPPPQITPARVIESHDPLPGLIGYVLTVCLVAGMAGYSFFAENWVAAGRVDGELIRHGEIWRLVTALTLHADVKHSLSYLPQPQAMRSMSCCSKPRIAQSVHRPPFSPHLGSSRASSGGANSCDRMAGRIATGRSSVASPS